MKKRCAKCGLEKRISQDPHVTEFYPKTRWEDGSIRTWQGRCKKCQREDARHRLGIKRRGRPFNARRKPLSREQALARKRTRYHELKKDPQWMQKRREDQRMNATLRRRAQGIHPRGVVYRLKEGSGGAHDLRVPKEPFIEFFNWYKQIYRREFLADISTDTNSLGYVGGNDNRSRKASSFDGMFDVKRFCDYCNITRTEYETLRRISHPTATVRTVSLALVERFCLAIGMDHKPTELYPDL